MAKKAIDYKRKLQNQNIIIIALAITIFILVVVSSTAAWYITTRTDTVDIVLGSPVNPFITSRDKVISEEDPLYVVHSKTENLLGNNTRVYPGDQITMKLGVQLGDGKTGSSPAYVRVKLTILYENVYTGASGKIEDMNDDFGKDNDPLYDEDGNQTESNALIEYNNSIARGADWAWAEVNFNQDEVDENGDPLPADNWYVLQNTITGNSKIVYDLEKFSFIDGTIELSELNITNKYANCKFHIQYTVEAIQVANVEDPINQKYVDQEGRTNPWWIDQFIYFDELED